jgi:hypothetical protein
MFSLQDESKYLARASEKWLTDCTQARQVYTKATWSIMSEVHELVSTTPLILDTIK